MRFHTQLTTQFFLIPRMRVYRRPLLIWVRWFGKSFYVDRGRASAFVGEDRA